jgi:uncharacterized protein YegP (UPF0339 family)
MMDRMTRDELAELDLTEDEIDAMMAEGEPVESTGPFDPVRRVRFELIAGNQHSYRWRLVAANGEILATSNTQYHSKDDVRRAIATLATAVPQAPVIDDADTHTDHRKAS